MTKTQYRKKCRQLKREAIQLIDEHIEKALNSGAIELSDYENNYLLPKIVMCAIAHRIVFRFTPPRIKHKKEVKNILHFLYH